MLIVVAATAPKKAEPRKPNLVYPQQANLRCGPKNPSGSVANPQIDSNVGWTVFGIVKRILERLSLIANVTCFSFKAGKLS